jgi:hypothetical protein
MGISGDGDWWLATNQQIKASSWSGSKLEKKLAKRVRWGGRWEKIG